MALHLDPQGQPDPERDEELQAHGAQVEIRPASRVAHLAIRSLACPSCGVPVALSEPVRWDAWLSCAFCDRAAPTREYVREQGWPQVELRARLG